jgi:hypothetical protein
MERWRRTMEREVFESLIANVVGFFAWMKKDFNY